ncbi:hypothetical protein R1flu_028532 [Riccia fluitans]|uniref:Uncharacterized protein n=1 Tax=Riccia fluitans TaxID=41844 RepID=A0ABD1XMF2_9MARC
MRVFQGNKVNPMEVWNFLSSRLRKGLLLFSAKELNFGARLVVLSFLLQVLLPSSLAMVKFSMLDLAKLNGLLSVFLWGTNECGKAKTTLVVWRRLAVPKDLGGAGLWSFQTIQQGLLMKNLFGARVDPSSIW